MKSRKKAAYLNLRNRSDHRRGRGDRVTAFFRLPRERMVVVRLTDG
ncbi:MAG: hypothetical protein ACLSIP_17570 [Hungatella sp.]